MTDRRPDFHLDFGPELRGRLLLLAGYAFATGYILFGDYPALAVPAIVAFFFAAYVWLRVMIYLEGNRFSPDRLRVSLTWALVGIDNGTNEYDIRPVRVYFILLSLMFTSLVLRPLLGFMF